MHPESDPGFQLKMLAEHKAVGNCLGGTNERSFFFR